MRKLTTTIAFAAGAAAALTAGTLVGFGPEHDKAPHAEPDIGMPTTDELMEMWAKAGTPGDKHKALKKYVGEWAAEGNFQMPGQDPITFTGTMTCKPMLDGRFIQSDFRVDDFMGQPYHGVSILGYDNQKEQYQSVWLDTMATFMIVMTGEKTDKKLTLQGMGRSPAGENPMRIVTEWTGDNTITDTFYDKMPTGDWAKTGTITYTRK